MNPMITAKMMPPLTRVCAHARIGWRRVREHKAGKAEEVTLLPSSFFLALSENLSVSLIALS